ncbi:dATP/dGTP pyrophosphohydrolase domain-containing protein [Citrobacter braakii]|uniref:dATP/dGTP pyrophosphohydrolase domain-containing protein n=1 Tax=Citrobacter braakii TaxID=57706 RepID=UPI0039843FF9
MTTNNKLTDNQLTKIIESAEAVISALAGTNEDVHPDNSTEMCRLYDWLNDNDAPPEVVLAMAIELQERRKADSAEPIYQWRERYEEGSLWDDCTKAQYDGFAEKTDCEVRILYTAPPAAVVQPVMFIDGDISASDAEKLAAVIREWDDAPAPERDQVRREHAAWSDETFGDVGPVGPLKHLSKEAIEAAAEPGDLSEWADIQFLLWDAQRRAGISDEQITQAMVEKLAVNKQREWPEPKDGEPRLHIKEQSESVLPGIECDICGHVSTDPEGRHYCCEDNSND